MIQEWMINLGVIFLLPLIYLKLYYLALSLQIFYYSLKYDLLDEQFKHTTWYKISFFFYCIFNKEKIITTHAFKDIELIMKSKNYSMHIKGNRLIPKVIVLQK